MWGGGVNLNGQRRLATGVLNWVGGIETFREATVYGFHDNLNNRHSASIDSRRSIRTDSGLGSQR